MFKAKLVLLWRIHLKELIKNWLKPDSKIHQNRIFSSFSQVPLKSKFYNNRLFPPDFSIRLLLHLIPSKAHHCKSGCQLNQIRDSVIFVPRATLNTHLNILGTEHIFVENILKDIGHTMPQTPLFLPPLPCPSHWFEETRGEKGRSSLLHLHRSRPPFQNPLPDISY